MDPVLDSRDQALIRRRIAIRLERRPSDQLDQHRVHIPASLPIEDIDRLRFRGRCIVRSGNGGRGDRRRARLIGLRDVGHRELSGFQQHPRDDQQSCSHKQQEKESVNNGDVDPAVAEAAAQTVDKVVADIRENEGEEDHREEVAQQKDHADESSPDRPLLDLKSEPPVPDTIHREWIVASDRHDTNNIRRSAESMRVSASVASRRSRE